MIKLELSMRKGTVYVDVSQNDEELWQLTTLARELKMICSMGIPTGLWIVADSEIDGRKIVATSLNKAVEISDDELALIRKEVKMRKLCYLTN